MNPYVLLATEFFSALSDGFQLIPKFPERRKKEIQKEIKILAEKEKQFLDYAHAFEIGSDADVLMGLQNIFKVQEKKIKDLFILYAKELES